MDEADDKVLAAIAALRDGMREMIHDQVTGLRVAVMDRFDRVETRLTQISDDITVNMGRADRAHAAADSTRAELRALGEEVAALTRKQRRMETQLNEITRPPGRA